jgi:hypothetical protein
MACRKRSGSTRKLRKAENGPLRKVLSCVHNSGFVVRYVFGGCITSFLIISAGKKKSVSISAIAAHKIASAGQSSSARGKAQQVKRSRNKGVDLLMRLDGHTGDDSYADLENFLV